VLAVLAKRFARYGLTLHPEKTKLIDFRKPRRDDDGPGTFDMLGFTHFWGTSQKRTRVVQRKTARGRFGRALQRVAEWCRKARHLPVREQYRTLAAKLRGHYAYYGITGNSRALGRFFHEVKRAWQKWLNRRSNRARMNWHRFALLTQSYPLPTPRIVHSVYRR
jgi:hypothetical protein